MTAPAAPTIPRVEHRTDTGPVLGVPTPSPRLSWTVEEASGGWKQTAYEVEVVREHGPESAVVDGDDQVLVPWPFAPLQSRERVEVRVRVAGADGWSRWSEPRAIEAGLLSSDDWAARFVAPGSDDDVGSGRAPMMLGRLAVPGPVRRARLYASAHGVYLASVNGRRVGNTVLAPGWTSYPNRLRYHVYDVTDLVVTGENRLELLLGNGWYRGRLGWMNERALYGRRRSVLAQLEVLTEDGVLHRLATDGTWSWSPSDVVADDLYDGQTTDLRVRDAGPHLQPVTVLDEDLNRLAAPDGPPIRPVAVLQATRVFTSPSGATLVDFGQNLVGWVRLRARGLERGSTVVVRHAEVLESDEIGTRPLRTAEATDRWILAGPHEQTLEPSLTLHGFRYAEVTGMPELTRQDVQAVVVASDLRRTGWFDSSHDLLNRLHENVVWSMRGNFVDIPTDCPQRDERLGWTGDAQVFGPTASFLFDTAGFLTSWLADLAAEQAPDGSVPHVVPDASGTELGRTPAAAWGDAATVLPWTLYRRTGDRELLARQLSSMCAWVDKVTDLAGPDRLWTGGFQFGDWLDPTAPPDDPGRAKADPDVVATACFARSAQIVADAAAVLGRVDIEQRYRRLADEVRAAFLEAFVTRSGRIVSEAQTAYAVAIEWDLLPTPGLRAAAGHRLADLVRGAGFRIATGFVGTPLVCDALTATGHADVAYRLLLQTRCPSWLYPVTMGATTVWERWDSMLPDGSINPGEMTSFNHYALGAVADWMHRTVAGLAPGDPGYRRIVVRPVPTPALEYAAARHLTPFGEASVRWRRDGGRLTLYVRVPVGAVADVHVPGSDDIVRVGPGTHEWDVHDPTPVLPRSEWSAATVRDLMDDPETWGRVVALAVQTGSRRGEVDAARALVAFLDAPASEVASALAPDERAAGARELRSGVVRLLEARTAVATV